MWGKLKKVLGLETEEYPLSSQIEFLGDDDPVLSQMSNYWKEPWMAASAHALRLLSLQVSELINLPEETSFELPQDLGDFSGVVVHGVLLNGDHTIDVIVSSERTVDGKESICASFEISHQGEIAVQPRPMWSGPNSESLVRWVYGYEPQQIRS